MLCSRPYLSLTSHPTETELPLLSYSWNCSHLGTSNHLIVISSGNLLVLISLSFLHLTFIATFLVSMNLHFHGATYNLLTILALFLFVDFFYAPCSKWWYSPDFIFTHYSFYSVLSTCVFSTITYKLLIPKLLIFSLDFSTELQTYIFMDDLWTSQNQHILNWIYDPCFQICSSCSFVSFVGMTIYHSGKVEVWKSS